MRSPFKAILLLTTVFTVFLSLSLKKPKLAPAQQVQALLLKQADSLVNAVKQLDAIALTSANSKKLQEAFVQVRLHYKKIEWAAEYFAPLNTRLINEPPVPEVELSGQVIYPDGMQVMETYLFPSLSNDAATQWPALQQRLLTNTQALSNYFTHAELQDWRILDALKLEVFKIEALGLNDFDDPLLKNCFTESAVALQSLATATNYYGNKVNFKPCISYLRANNTLNNFNYADFLRRFANPLTQSITALTQRLALPNIRYNRLLNQNTSTLFAADAFNCNAFIAAPADSATPTRIILGKQLFFDPVLSGNGQRSCASCHQPQKAFTDGMTKNLNVDGKQQVARNTPTLINAALQPAQFYDLRAVSLEDQATDVINNKNEMHGNMQVAVNKLWLNKNYRAQFAAAYPTAKRQRIDTGEVLNALASYIRSLTLLNSRFDRFMRGNAATLTQQEIKGFNLFMGKAACSTCHFMPLFNGALPPRYIQMETEVLGVPQTNKSKTLDTDLGLFNIQPFAFNKHAFKTTTVRNTNKTAPYMHNGAFNTLEEVIDFYDNGGGSGMQLNVPNQTLSQKPLHLTAYEKACLVAFLKSLDSVTS